MERFSPKIEIINHFDNLINRIDIDIDSCLENYNDQQLLSEILKSSEDNRKDFKDINHYFKVKFFDTFDSSNPNVNSWPESTKVVDYLKQIRMKTIEELRNAQEETLEYYKLNSDRFKSELTDEKNIEGEFIGELFAFQIHLKQSEKRFWLSMYLHSLMTFTCLNLISIH
jgi:hypothetical protein